MDKISYTALVLDEKSKYKLNKIFQEIIPEDFEFIAHHMTIKMGGVPEEGYVLKHKDKEINIVETLGFTFRLSVDSFGFTDKVIALGVSGFPSENENPHVTLAVNRKIGGKPQMSNEITNWQNLKRPFHITGKVEEIPYRMPENNSNI